MGFGIIFDVVQRRHHFEKKLCIISRKKPLRVKFEPLLLSIKNDVFLEKKSIFAEWMSSLMITYQLGSKI